MMRIITEFTDEFAPFKDFLTRKFENQQTKHVASSSKTVPLKELQKELFYPTDQDNKDRTVMMEHLAAVASQAWIDELMDSTKVTQRFISDSEGEYSYEHSSEELKKALLGMVDVNDLAESSFFGVNAQVQVYGRIGMDNKGAISDMARKGFMHRPTTASDMRSSTRHGLFYGLPEELKITEVMNSM